MQSIDILLVEDNEGDILLTREALQDLKMINRISTVKDGVEAINYLAKRDHFKNVSTPHLILLDINLPKLNGQAVLKQIKTNSALDHFPVIMVSTSSCQKEIAESLTNGANGYLTKPIIVSEFIQTIFSIEKLGLKSNQTIIS